MRKLTTEDLKIKIDIPLDFEDTSQIEPLEGFMGQPRAVKALEFGLNMRHDGFHVFVAGKSGTGRLSLVRSILKDIVKDMPVPDDWVYVYNFKEPSEPHAINLPPGKGRELKEDIERLIEDVKEALKRAFEDEGFVSQKESIIRKYVRKREEFMKALNQQASELGFILQPTTSGFLLIPTIGGQPISNEDLQKLDETIKNKIDENARIMEEKIAEVMKHLRRLDRELKKDLMELERETARTAVADHFEDYKQKYSSNERIIHWLKQMEEDVLANVEALLKDRRDVLVRYKVNLFVDNSELDSAPIVMEPNPTLPNLVGKIEKEMHQGILLTDFTMIKAGAFHKANGGFLIIDALDLLKEPFSYEILKKTLENKKIIIEDIYQRMGIGTKTLKPEPIPFSAKVILIGEPIIYYLLYNLDPEFSDHFKVKAEFDGVIELSEENVKLMTQFIASLIKEEGLLHWTRGAIEELFKHVIRYTEDRKKLTARFAWLRDVILETDFWTRRLKPGNDKVEAEDVKYTFQQIRYRSSLIEEKIREYINRGFIIIELDEERVGVINGLSVLDLGDMSFGRPSRITATVSLGKEGIIDIEKEVGLGGKIHSKGVQILAGYFNERYGGEFPISLQARLTFEQSYGMVEGDSASAAELIALLSALSEVPIKPYIAITGSINQKGQIQPIGGVNEKIEGFFYTLKAKNKLDGKCGVIIPMRNLDNLALRDEVIEAVDKGKFNIWAVEHVDEAMEILMGIPSQKVHDKVKKKLKKFYRSLQKKESKKSKRKKKRVK